MQQLAPACIETNLEAILAPNPLLLHFGPILVNIGSSCMDMAPPVPGKSPTIEPDIPLPFLAHFSWHFSCHHAVRTPHDHTIHLSPCWLDLGPACPHLSPSGVMLAYFGASWPKLEPILAHFDSCWPVLGPFWLLLAPSCHFGFILAHDRIVSAPS